MKKKDVVTLLYSGLGDVFGPYGFRLVKSAEAFIRKTPSGDQRLYVSVEDLSPDFVFTVVIGIRIDSVEKICHQFSGAPEQYQGMSVSSITQLGYFLDGKPCEYNVSTPEQISSALKSVSALLVERVVPFLDRCTDAESLDRQVNSEASRGFNVAQLPYGAMTAVTLAYLAKNPMLTNVISRFKEEMRLFPETERQKLDSLVSYLSSHAVNN
ncbi:MAG: hypothetical protein LWW81_02965 [Rhodocyclales bacterium]|nr:hypothetical protein [Rhodocyclales bacterium]